MTMMDDVEWILKHIRNSYITSDDTGVCEMVIQPEMVQDNKKEQHKSHGGHLRRNQRSVPNNLKQEQINNANDDSMSNSPDILPDMDFGAHRLRSNTALRLERMKKEKTAKSKIRNISWRTMTESDFNAAVNEDDQLFEKKDIPKKGERKKQKRASMLSQQLEINAAIPDNPFSDFAKFDGRASSLATKKLNIFLTMVSDEDKAYPLKIVTLATARVQDLIGLICWQYTNEGRNPTLGSNLESYSLHIAEDDGEVDLDFPNLDNREPISKFGFTNLALVQKVVQPNSQKSAILLTVNVPDKGFSKFRVENDQVSMKDILAKVLNKRKVKNVGLQYNLEKQCEPGVSIDLEMPLSSMETREFCLMRENSSRGKEFIDFEDHNAVAESLSSHQYKSYRVSMSHKLRPMTTVQIGISGEKVEIDPLSSKGAVKLLRQKPVTYEADIIATCEITEEKSIGKATFRLVFLTKPSTHDYKHHDFEAETPTAKEIVQKINNILELRSSLVRKEYVAFREKKIKYNFPT